MKEMHGLEYLLCGVTYEKVRVYGSGWDVDVNPLTIALVAGQGSHARQCK